MPPDVNPIPLPKGWGADCVPYLQAHNIHAVTPAIHSSDFNTTLSDPFFFYLTRRLGIRPLYQRSEALNRGSWLHRAMELLPFRRDAKILCATEVAIAEERLDQEAQAFGMPSEEVKKAKEDLQKDFVSGMAWAEAYLDVPFEISSREQTTLRKYLARPYWRVLGTEMVLVEQMDQFTLVAPLDLLLYHEGQNSLWILDYKSTSAPTHVRLATCPIEPQTWHYLNCVHLAIQNGHLDVPSDARVGGMIHVAMRKPTIQFGMNDRPYTEEARALKSGPRKGQVVMEKKYHGEPDYDLYLDRCQRWIKGTGEYEAKAEERQASPPIALSITSGRGSHPLDDVTYQRYLEGLFRVQHYATIKPVPDKFPMNPSSLDRFGSLSPYAPLYLEPPAKWPELLRLFKVEHRDQELDLQKPGVQSYRVPSEEE